MKFIRVVNTILLTLFLLLAAFDLLLVLPEYCACRTATEGATVTTLWGYTLDCVGDTAEFSLAFFKLIGSVALLLLVVIIILNTIHRKLKRRKLKSTADA